MRYKCGVCIGPLADPVLIRECGHVFCDQCLRQWTQLRKKSGHDPSCPYCRMDFTLRGLVTINVTRRPVQARMDISRKKDALMEKINKLEFKLEETEDFHGNLIKTLEDNKNSLDLESKNNIAMLAKLREEVDIKRESVQKLESSLTICRNFNRRIKEMTFKPRQENRTEAQLAFNNAASRINHCRELLLEKRRILAQNSKDDAIMADVKHFLTQIGKERLEAIFDMDKMTKFWSQPKLDMTLDRTPARPTPVQPPKRAEPKAQPAESSMSNPFETTAMVTILSTTQPVSALNNRAEEEKEDSDEDGISGGLRRRVLNSKTFRKMGPRNLSDGQLRPPVKPVSQQPTGKRKSLEDYLDVPTQPKCSKENQSEPKANTSMLNALNSVLPNRSMNQSIEIFSPDSTKPVSRFVSRQFQPIKSHILSQTGNASIMKGDDMEPGTSRVDRDLTRYAVVTESKKVNTQVKVGSQSNGASAGAKENRPESPAFKPFRPSKPLPPVDLFDTSPLFVRRPTALKRPRPTNSAIPTKKPAAKLQVHSTRAAKRSSYEPRVQKSINDFLRPKPRDEDGVITLD